MRAQGGKRTKNKNSGDTHNSPIISVMTISLNSRGSIENTIKSILNQPLHDSEFLVIDGGSTDGTVNVIKEYEDSIDYWLSEPDRGVSHAFNKGIKLASGKYVIVVNADDMLEAGVLSQLCELCRHSDEDVICGAVRFCENGREIMVSYPDINRLLIETSVHHAGVLIRKNSFEEYGLYDESFKYAMDYELLLRFKLSNAKFIAANIIVAERTLGGLSYSNRHGALLETMRARGKYFSYTNAIAVFAYVYLKDMMGRLLKKGPWKFFYKAYWNYKNKKLTESNSG